MNRQTCSEGYCDRCAEWELINETARRLEEHWYACHEHDEDVGHFLLTRAWGWSVINPTVRRVRLARGRA